MRILSVYVGIAVVFLFALSIFGVSHTGVTNASGLPASTITGIACLSQDGSSGSLHGNFKPTDAVKQTMLQKYPNATLIQMLDGHGAAEAYYVCLSRNGKAGVLLISVHRKTSVKAPTMTFSR